MIKNRRVVVFTPWGRELTGSLLYRHLLRDKLLGVVDEWHLWMNMDEDQDGDREYALKLARENDWIKTFDRPEGEILHPKQMNTGRFYVNAVDSETIYVRMDDDIVYIEPNAIRRLVEYRINFPSAFVVFPIIWNNAVVSYWLQQMRKLPEVWGVVGNHCMDPVGWSNPHFAYNIHNHLLAHIDHGKQHELFMHHPVQLQAGQQFSVSCFAQAGEEYARNPVVGEEEAWHTIGEPIRQNRPNLIVPNSLVSHFSFYGQRDFLLSTNILERYSEIAQQQPIR